MTSATNQELLVIAKQDKSQGTFPLFYKYRKSNRQNMRSVAEKETITQSTPDIQFSC